MEEKIDYIEINIFDGQEETVGLLANFSAKSSRLRLITDNENTNELFDLDFFSITRILVAKSSTTYAVEEQYVFKKVKDDQETAKTVLINQLKMLAVDGRTTASGFITRGTFVNIPEKYTKQMNGGISAAHIVRAQRAETLGGPVDTSGTKNIGQTPVYTNQYNNYAKKNVKTVIFIARSSNLPSKAALKKMKKKVKEVSDKTYNQQMPAIAGDDESKGPSQADIDDALLDVYGNGMHHGNYCGDDY